MFFGFSGQGEWMKIICNGEARDLGPGQTVARLLCELSLDPATMVVECDGRVLPKEEFKSHQLQEGSVVELIRFVGGG